MESIEHAQAQEYLHQRRIDLSEDELRALQAHLAICAECRAYAISLEDLQGKLGAAFHTRWDAIQPVKSRTSGILVRWGRETMKSRVITYAWSLIGVLAIIALIIGLDFIIRNLRPQPATVPIAPTSTSTSQPTLPEPTEVPTSSNSLVPLPTPLPEGTIVLNWGYAITSTDPDSKAFGDQWTQALSTVSGLNVVALPGPSTSMEILEAIRDGKIHMAELDALTFIYGQSQGWVLAGPVMEYPHTPSGSIMFVARVDSGLVKGEPPQVFQQLAGKRPCWPDINQGWHMSRPPIYEYVLPKGLLAETDVQSGDPVFVIYTETHRDVTTEVFLGNCDFAVVQAIPEEYFLMVWSPYLGSKGFTIDDWATQMQVLYTTPELEPYRIMAFSSQLEALKREKLANALLSAPGYDAPASWVPYDAGQAKFFDRFRQLVVSSGVDIAEYLNRIWDEHLLSLIRAAKTPSPTLEPTNLPTTRALTICMGAEPETLDFNVSNMLAQTNILEAIYDGPIDSNGFSYQPVILEKLPSLADGDASIKPVLVKENDYVVNDAGEVVLLRPGQVVRPFGCNLTDCAITWQGGPLEMSQLSATFVLRRGIRWSDGEPLTADDSVFGYEVATGCRTPEDPNIPCGSLGAIGSSTLTSTASYTALDKYTTQWVGLPGFLDQAYMTNFAHPLPRHQAQQFTPQQFRDILATKPMGWGPYKIDHWQPGEYIRLNRNPFYFRANEGLPHFDQLTIRFLSGDEGLMLDTIQNGECDLLDQEAAKSISLGRLVESENTSQVKALISTGTTWEHLDFNIQPAISILNSGAFAGWDLDGDGQGPFGDVRLRQALTMCLDRQNVIDTLLLGKSLVPDTYLSPSHPLYNASAIQRLYDPQEATKLLDEIGWKDTDANPGTPRTASMVTGVPDGTPLVMNLETTTAEIRQQVFEILSKSLAECGIQVNLKTFDAMEFFKSDPSGRVSGRLYDLAEFSWTTGITPPCDLFISTQMPTAENHWSGQNNSGFRDSAFDAACRQQKQTLPGEAAYIQAVMLAQQIFSEQQPVVPLFLRLKYAAARPDMCGYSLDPSAQSDFWNIEAFDYGQGCK